ncbi:uncharacterized protein K02A2.6-like [Anneissia japonica]|uniref:uncharacterized protein K02A2.6-like n=1 Tax=Anneissia japonica TaxID=1529436 RepID=UPI00142586FD|nr:uncharacterized protein K02A2.6-like [Anneissia japonica]
MAQLGVLREFQDGENWTDFVERVEQYFIANEIKDDAKKRAVLLTVCNSRTYSLMKDLLAPAKVTDKSYNELTELLKSHSEPKSSIIVSRFKFYSCTRPAGQSVSNYVASLRRLAEPCRFGDTLEEMLRDRLVLGINDNRIQWKMLSETTLNFKTAVEIENAILEADANVKDINIGGTTSVNKVQHTQSRYNNRKVSNNNSTSSDRPTPTCYLCLGPHLAPDCKHKEVMCHGCGKRGHLRKACKNPKQKKDGKKGKVNNYVTDTAAPQGQQQHQAQYEHDEVLFNIESKGSVAPITVQVKLNGVPLTMEVDTGASISIMSETHYNNLWKGNKPPLAKSHTVRRTYTNGNVDIVGTTNVSVSYKNFVHELQLLVVKGSGPAMFGRNCLEYIKLDWQELKNITVDNCDGEINNIINKFPDVFKDGLGTYTGPKAKIHVNPDATPLYYKARAVPYMLRQKVEEALERDVRNGVVKHVETSEWAAPIVPVLKADGETVRSCGDYKLTMNKQSTLDNYPIPKEQDLFACLAGGKYFTKPDLANAYQQMLLDEE